MKTLSFLRPLSLVMLLGGYSSTPSFAMEQQNPFGNLPTELKAEVLSYLDAEQQILVAIGNHPLLHAVVSRLEASDKDLPSKYNSIIELVKATKKSLNIHDASEAVYQQTQTDIASLIDRIQALSTAFDRAIHVGHDINNELLNAKKYLHRVLWNLITNFNSKFGSGHYIEKFGHVALFGYPVFIRGRIWLN